MRRLHGIAALLSLALTIFLTPKVFAEADDTQLYTPEQTTESTRGPASVDTNREPASSRPRRTIQDDQDAPIQPGTYDDQMMMQPRRKKKINAIGAQVAVYYDAVSTFQKIYPYAGQIGQFGNNTGTGMGGMQVLFAYVFHNWEFTTGVDYAFPITLQGQQSFSTSYTINSQTLNVFGVKALQIGYRIDESNFCIVPYGGVGLYYGRDVVNLTNNITGLGQTNQVTYSKLLANFIAGVRFEFNFTQDHTFNAGLALEAFVPVKLADSLAQSGTANGANTSELPGYESNLQGNMDFMTSFGGRIMANVGVYF